MGLVLFSNRAATTLAGPLTPSSTTMNVATGGGALFPNPGPGEYFICVIEDASTRVQYEVIWVTAVSGDTFTIERGKEGTAAQDWIAGDFVDLYNTAGAMQAMVQVAQLQKQATNYSPAGGSANALTATLDPAPPSLGFLVGVPIRIKATSSNSGATSLNVNGLGAVAVVSNALTALSGGEITAGGIFEFVYDGTFFELTDSWKVPLNQANTWNAQQTFAAGMVSGGQDAGGFSERWRSIADPAGGKSAGWRNDGSHAYLLVAPNGSALYNGLRPFRVDLATGELYIDGTAAGITTGGGLVVGGSQTVNGGLTIGGGLAVGGGATFAAGLSAQQISSASGSYAVDGATGSGNNAKLTNLGDFPVSFSGDGWLQLPNGLIVQWGGANLATGNGDIFSFPRAFPNGGLQIVGTDVGSGAHAIGLQFINASQAQGWGRDPAGGAYISTALRYIVIGF